MTRQLIGRGVMAGLVALALVVASGERVAASCAMPPPLPDHVAMADAVFVGTVRHVTSEARTATVEVQEIWRGPDLPASVVVRGGLDEDGVTTSADRSFEVGIRYLFAVAANGGRLEDHACTATQPWTDELAALRPDDPREPLPSADGSADVLGIAVPTPPLIALLVVIAVGVAGTLAFRRRA
jgi:hypothetical protein